MNHYFIAPFPYYSHRLSSSTLIIVYSVDLNLGLLDLLGNGSLLNDLIGQEFLGVQMTEINIEPDSLKNKSDSRGSPEPDLWIR
jgi:hypothetical protein